MNNDKLFSLWEEENNANLYRQSLEKYAFRINKMSTIKLLNTQKEFRKVTGIRVLSFVTVSMIILSEFEMGWKGLCEILILLGMLLAIIPILKINLEWQRMTQENVITCLKNSIKVFEEQVQISYRIDLLTVFPLAAYPLLWIDSYINISGILLPSIFVVIYILLIYVGFKISKYYYDVEYNPTRHHLNNLWLQFNSQ